MFGGKRDEPIKIIRLASRAVQTNSGRWKTRQQVHGQITSRSSIELLEKAANSLSRLLAFVEKDGRRALQHLEGPRFLPFIEDDMTFHEDVYAVGKEEPPLALVVSELSSLHGQGFLFPAVVIPMVMQEDVFLLWVERNQSTGIRYYFKWASSPQQKWPEEQDVICELFFRTEAALQIITTLDLPTWAMLLAA